MLRYFLSPINPYCRVPAGGAVLRLGTEHTHPFTNVEPRSHRLRKLKEALIYIYIFTVNTAEKYKKVGPGGYHIYIYIYISQAERTAA